MAQWDPFKVLGITPQTSHGAAKAVYRKLAWQCHPDRNPGYKPAEIKFKAIQKAWEEVQDRLPKDPVPLDIPEGATAEEIDTIYAEWLSHPGNVPAAKPEPPSTVPDGTVWSTVASEAAAGAVVERAGPTGDWTRLKITLGETALGLEKITPDEAAQLIYSRPNAFAALKIVQRQNPRLCLYDAVLARAYGSSYKRPAAPSRSRSVAVVIRGAEAVDKESCLAALRDPLTSVAVARQNVEEIARLVQFQGASINAQLLKIDLEWLVEHLTDLAEKCARRRGGFGDGGSSVACR